MSELEIVIQLTKRVLDLRHVVEELTANVHKLAIVVREHKHELADQKTRIELLSEKVYKLSGEK